ncbi:hypothetical protein [Sphingopyxis sp. H115]|uniref:hypothetical protein n=1 Tax=Sphingopyxis sp. H115 TaxID=1759073 RepID=UPI00073631EC|nr:hypothetical protein [Sphingopyxis sp. H115]KTE11402.1 hypothetical protein ATE71_11560 [Sphingopyxis sp. H115]
MDAADAADRRRGFYGGAYSTGSVTDPADVGGPGVSIAAFSDPRPSAAWVVTRYNWPLRPRGICAAGPTAPGKGNLSYI